MWHFFYCCGVGGKDHYILPEGSVIASCMYAMNFYLHLHNFENPEIALTICYMQGQISYQSHLFHSRPHGH